MKKLLFFWAGLLTIGLTLCCTSCSKSKDDPVVDPEPEVIITPLPANPEPGKLYAISHDLKKEVCTFQYYFGDNSTEELRKRFSDALVDLRGYDSDGNELLRRTIVSPDFSHPWSDSFIETFTVPSYMCELIRTFKYHLWYYDDERSDIHEVDTEQSWRTPHFK